MLQSELFALLEGTADAAFTVTDQGEICSWNAGAEALFGYRKEEAIDRTCSGLLKGHGPLGAPVCEGACSVQQCALRGGTIPDFDMAVQTRDGRRIWVNVSTLLFEDQRSHRRLLVHLARDVTERKRREDLVQKIVEIAAGPASGGAHAAPVSPLSEQEQRILRLFADGRDSAEVARRLGITLATLRNHLHAINEKLRTHSRLEAVMHALKRGLI